MSDKDLPTEPLNEVPVRDTDHADLAPDDHHEQPTGEHSGDKQLANLLIAYQELRVAYDTNTREMNEMRRENEETRALMREFIAEQRKVGPTMVKVAEYFAELESLKERLGTVEDMCERRHAQDPIPPASMLPSARNGNSD